MTKRILMAISMLAALAASPQAAELPAICTANAGMAGHDMDTMAAEGEAQPGANGELMAGMDKMNTDMMAAATASDFDVAFVCSMIPHHLGAIEMAKAELANGDDPWARELAQAIIEAQEKEIAAMLEWIAKAS